MENMKKIEWALRVAIFGTFLGHGAFALLGKESWLGWIMDFTGFSPELAAKALLAVGIIDVAVAFIILIRPVRIIVLWAILWTSWTAIMRILPVIGDPIWEFFEKIIAPASSLALLFVLGVPKNFKDWFCTRDSKKTEEVN